MFLSVKRSGGICLVFSFIAHLAYGQINYPEPIGHVNDSANVIDSIMEQGLEAKLREYQKKTSIEIAVATVPSLEGVTVDEYALNLFSRWGIGDKDKNNGILLLVASGDRELRIEVGYGMEPDLTDGAAGDIIRNVIIPYFRDQKMGEGIIAGVSAILDKLGNAPFEARLEERRIAQEKRLADERRQAEEAKAFFAVLGFIIAVLIAVGIPIYLVYKKIKRNQRLKVQFKNNVEILTECTAFIREARSKYPEAKKALEELRSEAPEAVWRNSAESIKGFAGNAKLLEFKINVLSRLNVDNGWSKSEEIIVDISSLRTAIVGLVSLSSLIESVTKEFNQARMNTPDLLKKTLESIVGAKKIIEHEDVSDRARKYISDAEEKCSEAQSLINGTGFLNWLDVSNTVNIATSLVAKALNTAESDKSVAKEARRPKPVYRPSSSSSYRSSSSGSSRSGGFGGFGGGRSGGGGARGKW